MADLYIANKAPATTSDWFSHAWFMTRCLLKAGWTSKASSDGSAKETTGGIAACKWGAPATVQAGAGLASISTKLGDDVLITGVSGLVTPSRTNQGGSEGNYLTISGAASGANNGTWQISRVVSSTSCYVRNSAAVASDANNGAITWVEKSAITTTYGAMANGAWIVLRGPSTLKISFTTAPTGTFIRGENITQANTGAQGEVLGVDFEPSTGVGFMVVSPRLTGSGGGARGWSSSDVITGSKSAATVTPNSTPNDYVRELMIQRGTTLFNGTVYYACLDVSNETSSLYTSLAASAGCTATIPPGGGGTANAFPATGCLVVFGTGGSVSHSASPWIGTQYSNVNAVGNLQAFFANAIERTDVSADGSYVNAVGQPVTGVQSFGTCLGGLHRVDAGEVADLDPYAFYAPGSTVSVDTRTRTANASVSAAEGMAASSVLAAASQWVCFRRRGLSGESFSSLGAAFLFTTIYGVTMLAAVNNTTDPEKVAATAYTTPPLASEALTLCCHLTNFKLRKGATKYILANNGNLALDTFGAKQWLQTGAYVAGSVSTLAILIPYDGSSTPVQ